jgi:hypothetical protein
VTAKAKRPKAKRPKPRSKRKRAGPKLILRERRVIPWDELTPEEQANLKGLRQAEEKFKEQAEERAKLWPWPADFDWAEARKALSREMRPPKLGPAPQSQPQQAQSQPPPATPEVQPQPPELQSQPKARPKARVGAERAYDYEAIRAVAKDFPAVSNEPKAWWFERVRGECGRKRPAIKTPANDRHMGRIIGDLYSAPKATPSQD